MEVKIPLAEIKVIKTKGHKTDIKLSPEIILTMGYPSLDSFVEMNFTGDATPVSYTHLRAHET